MILSTDAEKAFGITDLTFKDGVLQALQVGDKMFSWILALHRNPTSESGSMEHIQIPLGLGMEPARASPYIPFFSDIGGIPSQVKNLRGIQIGKHIHKLAAFVDDILFFIMNLRVSLPNLMTELDRFQELKNFKINLDKSKILPISMKNADRAALELYFAFKWQQRYIKISGH